jgi:hypothetical protein
MYAEIGSRLNTGVLPAKQFTIFFYLSMSYLKDLKIKYYAEL